MFLNLLRQVQEEALSREVAKRKLPNEVRDEKWPLTVTPICGVSTPLKFSRSNFIIFLYKIMIINLIFTNNDLLY